MFEGQTRVYCEAVNSDHQIALSITSNLTLAESHWKQLELGHRQLLARLSPSMHIKTEYSGYSHSAID